MKTPRFFLACLALGSIALVATDCALDVFCEAGSVGCAVDSCANLERDGDETSVDCGGSCGPCAGGAACAIADDCASQRCFERACCEPPCVVTAYRFGGPDFDRITNASWLPDGSLIVAGEMQDTVDFGGGPLTSAGGTDAFVAAFAPDGTFRWQRRIGGPREEGQTLVAVTPSGHVWVAGIYQSQLGTDVGVLSSSGGYADLFILELDAMGETLQAKGFSSQGTALGVLGMVATADGGLVISGSLGRIDFGDGTVLVSQNGPFPGGPVDVFVAKLDGHLRRVWHHQLGDDLNDFSFGLELDPAGDVVVGLISTTATSFGGVPLDRPGNVLVSFSGDDGAYQWGRSYGGGFGGCGLSIDEGGDVLMLGNLVGEADLGMGKLLPTGTTDAIVARLDATGQPVWITQLSSDIESYGLAVRRDPGGGVFAALGVTGDLKIGDVSATTGADSLVFVRLDGGGTVEWARNVGGIMVGTGVGLRDMPTGGNVLAFGGYAGTLDLGALPPAKGTSDAFLTSLLP